MCELLLPLVILGFFVLLFSFFSSDKKPDAQHLKDWAAVPTLAGQGFRALNTTSVIAIGKDARASGPFSTQMLCPFCAVV